MNDNASLVETRFGKYPGAVVLRMNRPQKRNALTSEDMGHLGNRLAELQHDADTRVIIITGTDKAFTGGQDINDINALSGPALSALFERGIDMLTRVVSMPKIVITAVNGSSAGMGNHLALCSDICVVKRSAKFHFTGAAKAIPSLMVGTLLLPATVGLKRAKALYLRGGTYLPEQALADGFCNEVIDDERWDETIEALAAEFSARSMQTMAHNKYQLNQGVFQLLGAAKLSGLAGAGALSSASAIPTGRLS